jgi:ketosteroid isomerase-like protein
VVALAKESATRNGNKLETDETHVWHLDNGKATEFWGVPKDQYQVDEFWV